MSKLVIKSHGLSFVAGLAAFVFCFSALSERAVAQSRKAEKQRIEELSYRTADTRIDPNATIVRGTPRSRLSPAEQMTYNLIQRRTELQEQVDLLGAELKTARGSRAKKITKELDILADQLAVVNRKLEALPKPQTIREAYSSGRPFKQFVDSLVDRRIEEEGYVRSGASKTPTTDGYKAPTPENGGVAEDYRIVFRVQLGVTARPNEQAYAALPGVKMQKRTDGKYAYYYGSYPNFTEAQAVCKRLQTNPKYRDAFVVALQGGMRLSIQEAVRLSAGGGR